jgi:hypothetical protein
MAERYWASLEETVDEMEMVIPTRNRLLLLAVRDLKAIAYDMREEESDRCLNEIEAIHLCIQNYKEWLSRRPNLPHSHRDENHNNTQKAIPESHIQKPMPTLEAPNPTTPNYESSGAAATSNGLESEQKITGPGLHLRKQPNFQPRVPKRAPPSESGQTAKKPKLRYIFHILNYSFGLAC